MKTKFSDFSKVKKKYLKFIKSQEVAGELFKDKLGQLNNYYIPISEMIYKKFNIKINYIVAMIIVAILGAIFTLLYF